MHNQYHHMKPWQYLYLATQMTKGMVKITMALLQCFILIFIYFVIFQNTPHNWAFFVEKCPVFLCICRIPWRTSQCGWRDISCQKLKSIYLSIYLSIYSYHISPCISSYTPFQEWHSLSLVAEIATYAARRILLFLHYARGNYSE